METRIQVEAKRFIAGRTKGIPRKEVCIAAASALALTAFMELALIILSVLLTP